MTNAERMKKYREKIKTDKVKYEAVKAKQKLTGASLAEFRTKNKLRQQKYREN
jgi:hypothetical protein